MKEEHKGTNAVIVLIESVAVAEFVGVMLLGVIYDHKGKKKRG